MKKNVNQEITRIQEMINVSAKKDLGEAGFARAARTMRGIVPSIKTIAIVTAENPMNVETPSDVNKSENTKLRNDLVAGKHGFRQIQGSYGRLENPFLINNISREDAIALGRKYKQESIIFGEVKEEGDYIGMTFELIGTDPQNTEVFGTKDVFVSLDNPEDYYSEIKGRKFIIPFYGITDVITQDGIDTQRERDYSDTKWDGGKAVPSSTTLTPLQEELNRLVDKMISTVGSTSYNYRGMFRQKLKEYLGS